MTPSHAIPASEPSRQESHERARHKRHPLSTGVQLAAAADACASMQCDSDGGGGGAKQGSASSPFPVSLGPWPMSGGKGAAGALAASAAAATSAGGRPLAVGLSGPVAHLNLNYKGAEGTCREADARNTRSFTPPIPSVEVSLYLQPTLPPGAGRGLAQRISSSSGWRAGAVCSWPLRPTHAS